MSWPTVLVGEIAQQVRGVSYDKSQVSNSAAPGLRPVLRAGNIQEGSLLLDKDLVYVPDSCIAHQQLLRPGDIVIAASSGSIDVVGKAAQLSEPWGGSFGAFCKVIRPSSERVNPRYLHHYFQSTGYRRKVSSLAAGANINNLKNEHIDDLLLPLPPLEEQRRIAAILDKASSIQSAAAERAARTTAALYRSLLMEELSKMDADNVRLGDILEIARGGSPRPIQAFLTNEPSGINWIMIGDTVVGKKYITKTAKMIKPEGLSKTRLVTEGDLLLSNSMSFGRPYIMKTDGAIHDGWLLLRDSAQNSSPDYLYHVLGSPLCYSQFLRAAAGATVKNLNTAIVSSVEIPLPAFEKQLEVAARLDSIEVKVGSRFSALSIKAEELKTSLFGSFFGEG
jgi:type I restriction enzyme S subunit